MNRRDMLSKLQEPEKVWDMVVVGGGATGLGVAVDAAEDTVLSFWKWSILPRVPQAGVQNWYTAVCAIFKKEMSLWC